MTFANSLRRIRTASEPAAELNSFEVQPSAQPARSVAVLLTKFTGRQPIFLDPAAVDEVVAAGGDEYLIKMQGGQIIPIRHSIEGVHHSVDDLLNALFPDDVVQSIKALFKVSKRYVNPAAINGLDFRGGSVFIALRSGSEAVVGLASTDSYRAVVRAVYGDAAAERVKPLPVKVIERPKAPTRQEMAEREAAHERALQKPAAPAVRPGTQVSSASVQSQVLGVIDTADTLEMEAANIGFNPIFGQDERCAAIMKKLRGKMAELRLSSGPLRSDPSKVLEVKRITSEIVETLKAFPVMEEALARSKKVMEAQCERLSGLQQVETMEDQAVSA